MQAIGRFTKTDKHGYFKLNYPIYIPVSKERITILVDKRNDNFDEDKFW